MTEDRRVQRMVVSPGSLEFDERRPLNALAMAIHQWGMRKGWNYDGKEVNIAEKMLLIHSEISEAFEHYRNGLDVADIVWLPGDKPDGFGIELIDAIIRILHLCALLGLDIDRLMATKMEYNETRPYRHGEKRA